MAHLQNPKKPACKEFILSGALEPLPAPTVQQFDAHDAAATRNARKLGRTYTKVESAALNACGKRIGCARA